MRLLLDTHALLWALSAPAKLPSRVRALLRAPTTSVFVSAASLWEICIKADLGKLDADVDEIATAVRDADFTELPVKFSHTTRLRGLPPHHRDPFDRLLIAQAVDEGLTIVSHDREFRRYPAPLLWS